jgi:hypothetical protein
MQARRERPHSAASVQGLVSGASISAPPKRKFPAISCRPATTEPGKPRLGPPEKPTRARAEPGAKRRQPIGPRQSGRADLRAPPAGRVIWGTVSDIWSGLPALILFCARIQATPSACHGSFVRAQPHGSGRPCRTRRSRPGRPTCWARGANRPPRLPSRDRRQGSPGSAGTTESPSCRLSAALTWYSPSTASREQVQKTSRPPGFSSVSAWSRRRICNRVSASVSRPDFTKGRSG